MSFKAKFTERELEILSAAFISTKTQIVIDYDKLAKNVGFKNKASASACYGPIKKKLDAIAGDSSGDGGDSSGGAGDNEGKATKPKTTRKRKGPAVTVKSEHSAAKRSAKTAKEMTPDDTAQDTAAQNSAQEDPTLGSDEPGTDAGAPNETAVKDEEG